MSSHMLIPLLLLTVGGMFAVLACCPLSKITWTFVRLIAVIGLAITTFVVVWFFYHRLWTDKQLMATAILCVLVGLSALAVVGVSPLLVSRQNKVLGLIRVMLVVGGILSILAGLLWTTDSGEPHTVAWLLQAVSGVLSAFFLGSVMVAWLLGHRYLTASEMTIDPLKRASQLLLIALGARWCFFVIMIVVASLSSATGEASPGPLARLLQDWFMPTVRITIGLFMPTIFGYMTWQCVKLRSTQSATGILFFMSIFVVIGELSSQYLVGHMGVVL